MAYLVSGTDLTSVANAIRTKGGTSAQLEFPSGFVTAIGNISGGGGASNVVTGTFTADASEKGTAKSVPVSYTGNGYPIAALIYPTPGTYKSDEAIYSLIQKKAIVLWTMVKGNLGVAPDYSTSDDNKNRAAVAMMYKANDTSASSYTGTGDISRLFYGNDPTASYTSVARFKSATGLYVFIANTDYGFKDGVEYTYYIVYSS